MLYNSSDHDFMVNIYNDNSYLKNPLPPPEESYLLLENNGLFIQENEAGFILVE